MNHNIAIANETIRITETGEFSIGGLTVELCPEDYKSVDVYSPERIKEMMSDNNAIIPNIATNTSTCTFKVVNEDSFGAAKKYENSLVMNFANAQFPGGGFRLGATAQEEALCRMSTLYASITSEKAKEMYQYNWKHFHPLASDYMLLSKKVCVFRDKECRLLSEPYMVSVITMPAPNKHGAAMFVSQKKIDEVMKMRIRKMLCIAAHNQYKTLILGAWGCGSFGHNPVKVSGYFKEVLCGENYSSYFDRVIFAILGKENGKNITAFRRAFGKNNGGGGKDE